jgi:hypothetical protein
VSFYEELPTDDKARKDMANHLTREDFFGLKDVMKYHLLGAEYAKL